MEGAPGRKPGMGTLQQPALKLSVDPTQVPRFLTWKLASELCAAPMSGHPGFLFCFRLQPVLSSWAQGLAGAAPLPGASLVSQA